MVYRAATYVAAPFGSRTLPVFGQHVLQGTLSRGSSATTCSLGHLLFFGCCDFSYFFRNLRCSRLERGHPLRYSLGHVSSLGGGDRDCQREVAVRLTSMYRSRNSRSRRLVSPGSRKAVMPQDVCRGECQTPNCVFLSDGPGTSNRRGEMRHRKVRARFGVLAALAAGAAGFYRPAIGTMAQQQLPAAALAARPSRPQRRLRMRCEPTSPVTGPVSTKTFALAARLRRQGAPPI